MINPDNKLFRWGPISGCPLFLHYTALSSFKPMADYFQVCYPESVILYKDGKVTWILEEEAFYQTGKEFVTSTLLDQTKSAAYFNLWQEKQAKLEVIIQRLEPPSSFPPRIEVRGKLQQESIQIKLSSLSHEEFIKLFNQFSKIYFDFWAVTMTIELVSVFAEPELGTRLKRIFPDERDANRAFAILTAPKELTFYRQEQLDLIQILKLDTSQRQSALAHHQKKYHWIYNSYLKATVLDLIYFQDEIGKLEQSDWKELEEEITRYVSMISKQKQELLEKIPKDETLTMLIRIVEKFGTLQDVRKALNFQADFILEKFVQEFSKRTKLSVDDLKLLLPEEISNTFKSIIARSEGTSDEAIPFGFQTTLQQTFQDRKLAFVTNLTKDTLEEISGQPALEIIHQFEHKEPAAEAIIHGMLASSGREPYFRGTAKIVLTIDELNKIEQGDILVTTMTSPDFVLAMKKAGAIVTDVGGVLSHAAIVSREFKIPCIVGTKIATKVIHDGDIIELHCGRGTVKIIRHSRG